MLFRDFPPRQALTMTMTTDSCRHGVIHGADVDPRRGVANENGLLSDDDDIDDGELDCVGSESLSTKRFPRRR